MRERAFLVLLAAVMAALFAVSLGIRNPPPAPDDLRALGGVIAKHPADRAALSKTLEGALDSTLPARFAVWHAAAEQSMRLDPHHPTAAASFVRSGLFHWYELSDADRRSVLAAIEPLLHDPGYFNQMAEPLFALTGDFALLRRANPNTEAALSTLMSMAVINGRFADYRALRTQVARRRFDTFQLTRDSATIADLIALLPRTPRADDLPLIRGLLETLHERPLDENPGRPEVVTALIDFALRHDLQPLDGLEALTHIAESAGDPQRARLAVRLGELQRATDVELSARNGDAEEWATYHLERAIADAAHHDPLAALAHLQKAEPSAPRVQYLAAAAEVARLMRDAATAQRAASELQAKANRIERWNDLCGSDVCKDASAALWSGGAPFALRVATVQSDNVPPFVEIYADDALVADGEASPALSAGAALSRGLHRVDVRLANPLTRNLFQRRVHIE
jgi:hypothetical protein